MPAEADLEAEHPAAGPFVELAAPEAPRLLHWAPAIPGFELLAPLGDGATGVVYRAIQLRTRREVAVKVLRLDTFAPGATTRFQREAELLARLNHPGIARVFEAGVAETGAGPVPWIALEYVEGVVLLQHVRRTHPPTPTLLQLFVELCGAVEHAHSRGVVHLDLKPANVLVDGQGRTKVLDFGIARSLEGGGEPEEVTRTGLVLGTLAYMSPEQARGERGEVRASADVYSLGVMLFEALTGVLPVPIDSGRALEGIRAVCEEPPRRLRSLRPELPRDLETILMTALAKEPERRYATAGALGAELADLLAHRPIRARRPGFVDHTRKFIRRHRVLSAASLVVVASLSLALTIALRGIHAEREARTRTSETLEAITSRIFDLAPRLGFGEDQRLGLYDVASRIESQLQMDQGNDDLRVVRARALFELAGLELSRNAPDAAQRAAEEARVSLEAIVARRQDDLAAWCLLSWTYAKLGEARRELGDLAGRAHWFRRAYELDLALVARHPGDGELVEDLGWSRSRIADLHAERRDYAAARAESELRLGEARRLVATELGNPKFLHNLSHASAVIAHRLRSDGDPRLAIPASEEAVRTAQELARLQPERRDFVLWTYNTCQIAKELAEVTFDDATALRYAQVRHQAAQELVYSDPTRLEHITLLQSSIHDIVRLLLRASDREGATVAAERYLNTVLMIRDASLEPPAIVPQLLEHAAALQERARTQVLE